MKKQWLIMASVAIAGSVMAWVMYGGGDRADSQAFRLAPVIRGNIRATVSSTGTLNPLNTVKVGSQVSGMIKALHVDFNSPVQQNQIIALLDPAFYEAQVEQATAQLMMAKAQLQENEKSILAAEAAVESAKAQLSSSKATLREAELKFKRFKSLDKEEVISKSDLDAALAKLENAHGAWSMAQAQVKTAEANLKRAIAQQEGSRALIAQREASRHLAEIQLDYCTIRSPIGGTVISRHVDVGQTVAASLQSPILFTIAEDLSRMQVEVDVSEADVGQIRAEQPVEFTVDAFPEKKFEARVRQVRNAAKSVQNVVTYTIVADVENPSLQLRPGMTANVTVVVDDVEDVLKVPNAALRFKPASESREEKSASRVPIRERASYKKTVDAIGLDGPQADQLEGFIKSAGEKLKAVYALPEEERDVHQAWKKFYTEINQKLYGILKGDQYEKFKVYIAALKTSIEKRRGNKKIRSAKVYVLNAKGLPEAHHVLAGVTDDAQTQIVSEALKEGDNVIVGISYDTAYAKNKQSNFLSAIMRR